MTTSRNIHTETGPAQPDVDLAVLREWAVGYQYTQVLAATAQLGLLDAIGEHARSAAEVAVATGTQERQTAVMLAVLTQLGLVRPGPTGYHVTARGALVRNGHPKGVAALLTASGHERYRAWGALAETLKSGRPSFPDLFEGKGLHDYYATRPAAATVFNRTMADLSAQTAADLLDAHRWAQHRVLADIGGGLGVMLGAILRATPDLTGSLVDLPHVAAAARDALLRAGLADRCTVMSVDARLWVPRADGYLFRMVLCDFPDDEAAAMLRACRTAAGGSAQVVIFDRLRGSGGNESVQTLMSTLNLMVMTGSIERTREEYAALLRGGGWSLLEVRRTPALAGTLYCLRAEPR